MLLWTKGEKWVLAVSSSLLTGGFDKRANVIIKDNKLHIKRKRGVGDNAGGFKVFGVSGCDKEGQPIVVVLRWSCGDLAEEKQ